jgi:hypothetical protein
MKPYFIDVNPFQDELDEMIPISACPYRVAALGSIEMRHHLGGEELHAAHDLHMRDHSADVEPADYASDIEFFAHLPEPLNACFRRVENRHGLTGLFVGRVAKPLDPFRKICHCGFRPCDRRLINGSHGLQVMINARLHQLPDLRPAGADEQGQRERNILAAIVGMACRFAGLSIERQRLLQLRKWIDVSSGSIEGRPVWL